MEPAAPNKHSRWPHWALLGFAFVAPGVGFYLARTNLPLASDPAFLSHLRLPSAALVPNCQWWRPVIRSFQTQEPEVWLTIDDGPRPEHTTIMLDLHDRLQGRATSFLIGGRAEKNPHLVT